MLPHVFDSTFGQHGRRKRDDGAVRVGQDFVDHSVTGDGGKCRCTVRAKHDKVSLLCATLIEKFLGCIAGNDDCLDGNLIANFGRYEAEQIGFDLFNAMAGKNLGAILRADYMLHGQPRMVLQGELGGEIGDDEAALNKADRTKNGTGGKIAIGAVDYFGADDQDRNVGGAQDGFSNGADENFPDGAG